MDKHIYRSDFPIFKYKNGQGKPFVYLDSAATSHKPACVIDRLTDFYTHHNANVHRGIYDQGEESTRQYEQVRSQVKAFINAQHNHEIIFTSGATEALNLIAASWALHHLTPGDEILVSVAEHHANLLPWQRVAQQTGAILRFLTLDPKRCYFNHAEQSLTTRTKLVAITHHSNVLGPVWRSDADLQRFIASAHAVGARVVLDVAQVMIHERLDVQMLDPDFVVFSGHKMLGPTGCGVGYVHSRMHDALVPYKLGGSMVSMVSLTHARFAPMPQLLEAGTPPISSVLGLGSAIDYMDKLDWQRISQHEAHLCALVIDRLTQCPGITIVGNQDLMKMRGHMVSFMVKGCHPHDVASLLSYDGIAVRAGYLCAQPLVTLLTNGEPLIRLSVALYNTIDDVTQVCQSIERLLYALRTRRQGASCITKNY